MGWQLYHCPHLPNDLINMNMQFPLTILPVSILYPFSATVFLSALSVYHLSPFFSEVHHTGLQWAFPNFPNSPLLLSISSLVLESLLPTFWPLKAKISVELKALECSLWNIFFTISTALPFSTNFSMVLWEGSSKQTVWCSIIDSCENSWCLNLVNLGNIWLALKEMTSYRKKGFSPFGTTKSFWDHFRYVF